MLFLFSLNVQIHRPTDRTKRGVATLLKICISYLSGLMIIVGKIEGQRLELKLCTSSKFTRLIKSIA